MAAGPDRVIPGILLMIGFTATVPISDTLAKLLGGDIAVGQILAARFLVQAALLVPLALRLGAFRRPTGREAAEHLLRAALILAATGALFTALIVMPIANAIAILFVQPFVLTLLGALLLGEEVGWRRVTACAVGFAGALLVIRPGVAQFGPAALLPLVTAFFFALYMIMTRRLAQRLHPVALQGHTALAALAIILPLLALGGAGGLGPLDPSLPTPRQTAYLAGVGVTSSLAHVMIGHALRLAPAATLAPLQYLEIVMATVMGYLVFADLPDWQTVVGIAVIVASGLYVFMRERAVAARPARPVPPS